MELSLVAARSEVTRLHDGLRDHGGTVQEQEEAIVVGGVRLKRREDAP